MKNNHEVLIRFLKVLYVFFILAGLAFSFIVSLIYEPYTTYTFTNTVQCNNGKQFDPASKPIYPNDGRDNDAYRSYEIGSECKYGTAYIVAGDTAVNDNYTEKQIQHTHYNGSLTNQIVAFAIAFISYMLVLEIIRRALRYIFTGKSLLKK